VRASTSTVPVLSAICAIAALTGAGAGAGSRALADSRPPDPKAARALDACYAHLVRDVLRPLIDCKEPREAYFRARGIEKPPDTEIAAAARALFGEGLDIQTSGQRMTISDGSLDQRTLERYAREHYFPALVEIPYAASSGVIRHLRDVDDGKTFDELGKKRQFGFVLTEPVSRLGLCLSLVNGIEDGARARELRKWCFHAAIKAARLPVFVHRPGETRTIEPGPQVDDDFPVDGATYVPRQDGSGWTVHVAASGTTPIESYPVQRSVVRVAGWLADHDNPPELQAEGQKLRQEFEDLDRKKREAATKAIARQIGSRARLLWSDAAVFDPWNPLPAMKSKRPACKSLSLTAWLPAKLRSGGGWHVSVAADGKRCPIDTFSEEDLPGPDYHKKVAELCTLQPGRAQHHIQAELRKLVSYKTDERRARVRDDSIEVYDVKGSKAGKLVAKDSITCGD